MTKAKRKWLVMGLILAFLVLLVGQTVGANRLPTIRNTRQLINVVYQQQEEINDLHDEVEMLHSAINEIKYASDGATPTIEYDRIITGNIISTSFNSDGITYTLEDGSKFTLYMNGTLYGGITPASLNHKTIKFYLNASDEIVGWKLVE